MVSQGRGGAKGKGEGLRERGGAKGGRTAPDERYERFWGGDEKVLKFIAATVAQLRKYIKNH